MKQRKNVDISELYDLFSARKDCCFVCCDIKAGDLVILETIHRMNNAAGPEDIVFRISGDEFALLTNSPEDPYAESIVRKLQGSNGEAVLFEEQEIPLFLHTGIVKKNCTKQDNLGRVLYSLFWFISSRTAPLPFDTLPQLSPDLHRLSQDPA